METIDHTDFQIFSGQEIFTSGWLQLCFYYVFFFLYCRYRLLFGKDCLGCTLLCKQLGQTPASCDQ